MVNITLISLLILMSVLLFVNRIYHQFKKQHFFSRETLTKIGTVHVFFVFVLYINYFSQPFWLWFFSFTSIIVVPLVVFIFIKLHQQQFYSDFLRFLSVLILKMQMGLSFRSAIERSLEEESWRHGYLLQHIYDNVVFSQQGKCQKTGPFGRFIRRVVSEFSLVHFNQHQAIDRLCKFRKNLQEELFFRRKSRQIWLYFGYQLGLLTVIYLAIFSFIVQEYGFLKFKIVFLLSLVSYFLGIFFVYIIGRRKEWRI